jgi:GTP cyclohydrolase IA
MAKKTAVAPERNYELVKAGFELILSGLGLAKTEHTARTAERAANAWWHEICRGLTQDPPTITTFPMAGKETEMVILRSIPVRSVCAHHLLPFVGTAAVAYLPGRGRVLGLSKLSRLVDYWARRPQVQEDLTQQVADAMAALVMNGNRGGVGVIIRANHSCMELRGVKHPGDMITSALRGVFKRPEVRAEFLRLAEM